MTKVLCVCVGNISRSPMMKAMLQELLGSLFQVESAGLSKELSGRPANHRSVTCMKERGIDLRNHTSRWIGDLSLDQYGWIITVGSEEAAKIQSMMPMSSSRVVIANERFGGIPDPYELGIEGYRSCVSLLDQVLPEIAEHIREN